MTLMSHSFRPGSNIRGHSDSTQPPWHAYQQDSLMFMCVALLEGSDKLCRSASPVVMRSTGCISHACLAWCGVMWCRSAALRVWATAWWRAGRPWGWASIAASLAWSPSLWKEPKARESEVLCSVLLHTLRTYDLLLTAYKSHGPKIRSACHLLSQHFQ